MRKIILQAIPTIGTISVIATIISVFYTIWGDLWLGVKMSLTFSIFAFLLYIVEEALNEV